MKHSLPLLALMAVVSIPSDAYGAATRNFGVSGYDRIRIDAPYEVRLTTGIAPFARAKADRNSALDSVTLRVDGRTLIISKTNSWGGDAGNDGPVVIELGTHDLSTVWLNGAGTLQVDKVRSMAFDLSVTGAGSAQVDAVDTDQLKVGITGSGSVRLTGRAGKTTAIIRGASSFDGQALKTVNADIGAEGPSLVKLIVSDTAKVDAFGLASVALQGNPACTVKTQGSASVTGCRTSSR